MFCIWSCFYKLLISEKKYGIIKKMILIFLTYCFNTNVSFCITYCKYTENVMGTV